MTQFTLFHLGQFCPKTWKVQYRTQVIQVMYNITDGCRKCTVQVHQGSSRVQQIKFQNMQLLYSKMRILKCTVKLLTCTATF